jgi:hypothetical protein
VETKPLSGGAPWAIKVYEGVSTAAIHTQGKLFDCVELLIFVGFIKLENGLPLVPCLGYRVGLDYFRQVFRLGFRHLVGL